MSIPDTWPRHMRRIQRYGRLEVGQRVRWERLDVAPTNGDPKGWLGRTPTSGQVEIHTEHVITEIRTTETGVGVVLRHASGAVQVAWGMDQYGHSLGDFASLAILAEAPEQRALIRRGEPAAASEKRRRASAPRRPALQPGEQAGLFE